LDLDVTYDGDVNDPEDGAGFICSITAATRHKRLIKVQKQKALIFQRLLLFCFIP